MTRILDLFRNAIIKMQPASAWSIKTACKYKIYTYKLKAFKKICKLKLCRFPSNILNVVCGCRRNNIELKVLHLLTYLLEDDDEEEVASVLLLSSQLDRWPEILSSFVFA